MIGIALHVHEMLAKVFAWDEGSFEFEPEDDTPGVELTLKLSTGELILEAVQAVRDPDVVRYSLGDRDRVLAPSADPLLRFCLDHLSPSQQEALQRDLELAAQVQRAVASMYGSPSSFCSSLRLR